MSKFNLSILLAATLLSGCTLVPGYDRPDLPTSSLWPFPWKSEQEDLSVVELGWRDFFRSAELQALIEKGLQNNRDLRIAALNVDAARAQYRVARSDLLPGLDGHGALTRQHTPGTTSVTGNGQTSTVYEADIGTTAFEIDLFGRVRSLNQAALEDYLATEEAKKAVQISLISEIARSYLQYLADQEQQKLSQQTFDAQQESFAIAQKRYDAGIGNQTDLSQAKILLETARVDQISYSRLIVQDRNALDVLIGAPVLDSEVQARFDDADQFVNRIHPGLPSDLLQNRPDIREAEHRLKADNADIGAARAAFFPNISLTATGGSAATALSDLFTKGSGTWSFVPQLTMPIFSGGRNISNLNLAEVRKNIGIAQYEKAIQLAFQDVADTLIARQTLGVERAAQAKLVDAAEENARLAELRYQKGVGGYTDVLIAQQNFYAAQQNLVRRHLAMLENYVLFYAALGGGQQERGDADSMLSVQTSPVDVEPVMSDPVIEPSGKIDPPTSFKDESVPLAEEAEKKPEVKNEVVVEPVRPVPAQKPISSVIEKMDSVSAEPVKKGAEKKAEPIPAVEKPIERPREVLPPQIGL